MRMWRKTLIWTFSPRLQCLHCINCWLVFRCMNGAVSWSAVIAVHRHMGNCLSLILQTFGADEVAWHWVGLVQSAISAWLFQLPFQLPFWLLCFDCHYWVGLVQSAVSARLFQLLFQLLFWLLCFHCHFPVAVFCERKFGIELCWIMPWKQCGFHLDCCCHCHWHWHWHGCALSDGKFDLSGTFLQVVYHTHLHAHTMLHVIWAW